MPTRVFAFVDAVRAIGVGHYLKEFIVFDQLVDQCFGILVVNIIVASAMDEQ